MLLREQSQKDMYKKWQEDYRRIFAEAGLEIQRVSEGPNRYCGDQCCPGLPAVTVTTQIGPIEFWWRKRVTEIDWSKSGCKETASQLFPKTADSSGAFWIHCWNYGSATERLKKIREAAAALEKTYVKEAQP